MPGKTSEAQYRRLLATFRLIHSIYFEMSCLLSLTDTLLFITGGSTSQAVFLEDSFGLCSPLIQSFEYKMKSKGLADAQFC